MAFNFMNDGPRAVEGINLCSRTLPRCSMALPGVRLTFADVLQLRLTPNVGVAGMLVLTIIGGVIFARLSGHSAAFGLLTGGCVAICGASAAKVIAAGQPKKFLREEGVLLTVFGAGDIATFTKVHEVAREQEQSVCGV